MNSVTGPPGLVRSVTAKGARTDDGNVRILWRVQGVERKASGDRAGRGGASAGGLVPPPEEPGQSGRASRLGGNRPFDAVQWPVSVPLRRPLGEWTCPTEQEQR